MASDVREYLRAAQAAEIRGDHARAIELLRTAASAYQQAGNSQRAEQMLRHAQRLQASSTSAGAMPPLATLRGPSDGGSLSQRAELAPQARVEAAEKQGGRSRRDYAELAERGPVLADPAQPAWCSFCCRPREEVGPLVAGPAGAFICDDCISYARSLISGAAISGAPGSNGAKPPEPHAQVEAESLGALRGALQAAADALSHVAVHLARLGVADGEPATKALVDGNDDPRPPPSKAASSRRSSKKKPRP